jgi:hypothetical protein
MFKVGEWPRGLLICLLEVLKNVFDEVAEAMQCEPSFYILSIEISDLDKVA